jgi:hypothetical protein
MDPQHQQLPAEPDFHIQQSQQQVLDEVDNRRPPNAFILFSQSVRQSLQKSTPGLTNTEYTKIMATMWKEASEQDRAKFKEEAAQLQKIFKEKFPQYTYKRVKKHRMWELVSSANPPPNSIFPPTTWAIRWDQLDMSGTG